MKIVCDFCKTEYSLDRMPSGPVKCVICGHTWVPHRPIHHNQIIKFMAAFCALIAAIIFAGVVVLKFQNNPVKNKPLVASIDESSVRIIEDKNGEKKIFVAGNITNNTDDLYGLPNIMIVSYDANKNVLSRQTFMPPVTLLESKTTVTFNHLLSVDPTNVKRVTIELKETK